MALRAAKADEDAAQGMWGQRFGAAAELPLGAERYVSAGSAGDLSSPVFFRTASSTESPWPCGPPKWMRTLGAGKHETGSAGDPCRRCSSGKCSMARGGPPKAMKTRNGVGRRINNLDRVFDRANWKTVRPT